VSAREKKVLLNRAAIGTNGIIDLHPDPEIMAPPENGRRLENVACVSGLLASPRVFPETRLNCDITLSRRGPCPCPGVGRGLLLLLSRIPRIPRI